MLQRVEQGELLRHIAVITVCSMKQCGGCCVQHVTAKWDVCTHLANRARQGRSWYAVPCWLLRHSTSVTVEDGTTTDTTWIGDGKRRQAGPIEDKRSLSVSAKL